VDYEKLKSGVIPLLAVMQGGEYAAPKRLDIFFTSRRLKTIKSRLLV